MLQNYARVFDKEMYPATLTDAVRAVTKYKLTAPTKPQQQHQSQTPTPQQTTQTALGVIGPGTEKGAKSKTANKNVKGKPELKTESKTEPKTPFTGECRHCGKVGHKW